jgi:hypothetical protein
MSSNHHRSHPAPRPDCAAVEPLLPLLSLDKVKADEAAEVRHHLATCTSCRRQLGELNSLRDALREDDAADDAIGPVLRMEDILFSVDLAETPSAPRHVPATRPLVPPRRPWDQLASLAAVLLLVTLAGLTYVSHGRAGNVGAGTAPALDPASQAYVSMLRTYYAPIAVDNPSVETCLGNAGNMLPNEVQAAQLMPTCRPLVAAQLTAASTFAAQLASTTPPARWRTQDAELRQATQGLIPILTAWLRAIDARDTGQFVPLWDRSSPALGLFQAPIAQINADIHVGPSPLPPPLPIPGNTFN